VFRLSGWGEASAPVGRVEEVMTKEDFKLIANVLRQLHEDGSLCFDDGVDYGRIVSRFSFALQTTNEKFDVAKFRAACYAYQEDK
jgi:hypothetical protein